MVRVGEVGEGKPIRNRPHVSFDAIFAAAAVLSYCRQGDSRIADEVARAHRKALRRLYAPAIRQQDRNG